jgi:hypothetical protein
MRKNNFYIVIVLLIFSSFIYPSQIWKSFILPGWGEKSLNNNVKGDAHLLSDLILFSSVFFCGNQYETYRNDYRIYGSDNAGVNWYGKNDLFAAHVGNYNSMEEFNNQQLLNFGPSAFTYSGESYYWDWNSDSIIRNQYDTWRNKSELYDEAKGFLIAGMLLNRIISMINVLSIEKENKIESNFYYDGNSNMNFQINYKF